MATQALAPEEQQEILRRIGGILLGLAPDGWTEIRCHYSGLVGISTIHTEAAVGDGAVHRIDPPDSVWDEMDRLRPGMYSEGKGTWFSAVYTIERPARFHVTYDYDNPPEFDVPPSDGSFVLEQRHFPRSEENIPEWMRERIRSAGEMSE
ncbi:hypothetical protein Q7689_06225 [Nocardiopsis tropica]|uniref:hypothetical protein n=1 Tax=Nocardiopsis tropica TaxID=109330 RepID=UPI002E8A6C36|nr:hypothetical protein [Nocardiopsis tropica]